jgi:hypothetical protein
VIFTIDILHIFCSVVCKHVVKIFGDKKEKDCMLLLTVGKLAKYPVFVWPGTPSIQSAALHICIMQNNGRISWVAKQHCAIE